MVKLFTIMQEIIPARIHKGFGVSAVQLNLSYTTDNTSVHKVTVPYFKTLELIPKVTSQEVRC